MRFLAGSLLVTTLATLSIVLLLRGENSPERRGPLEDRVREVVGRVLEEPPAVGQSEEIWERIEAVEAGLDLLEARLRAMGYGRSTTGNGGASAQEAGAGPEGPDGLPVGTDPALIRAIEQLSPAERSKLLLSSSSWDVRQRALAELTRLAFAGDEEARQALRDALSDPDPEIRRMAVERLGRLGDAEAIPGMIRMLREDGDRRNRTYAAEALGSLRDPSVASDLARALEDPETRVQSRALRSLGRLGNPDVVPAIEQYVTTSEGELKLQGIRTLVDLGDTRMYEEEVRRQREILASEDQEIEAKQAAIRTLGDLGGPEARKAISPLAEGRRSPVRQAARDALSQMDRLDRRMRREAADAPEVGQPGDPSTAVR